MQNSPSASSGLPMKRARLKRRKVWLLNQKKYWRWSPYCGALKMRNELMGPKPMMKQSIPSRILFFMMFLK